VTWITDADGAEHSACGRFVVYPTPEGFVCMDRFAKPLAFSQPYERLGDACKWADTRACEGREG
jgi:hypothetical protein